MADKDVAWKPCNPPLYVSTFTIKSFNLILGAHAVMYKLLLATEWIDLVETESHHLTCSVAEDKEQLDTLVSSEYCIGEGVSVISV